MREGVCGDCRGGVGGYAVPGGDGREGDMLAMEGQIDVKEMLDDGRRGKRVKRRRCG